MIVSLSLSLILSLRVRSLPIFLCAPYSDSCKQIAVVDNSLFLLIETYSDSNPNNLLGGGIWSESKCYQAYSASVACMNLVLLKFDPTQQLVEWAYRYAGDSSTASDARFTNLTMHCDPPNHRVIVSTSTPMSFWESLTIGTSQRGFVGIIPSELLRKQALFSVCFVDCLASELGQSM